MPAFPWSWGRPAIPATPNSPFKDYVCLTCAVSGRYYGKERYPRCWYCARPVIPGVRNVVDETDEG
jgi:hypothetical protein